MRILASTRNGLSLPQMVICALLLAILSSAPAFAQSGRDQVPGVHNFGKVTDRYFRGGQVTPEGVDQLHGLGVRTIIDLRDEVSIGEAEACERNGIKYYKFPMSGHETPNDNTINEILKLVQESKEPVYVHCSGGKHRAGTLAALYRMRVQGWSKERAWAEQQSYGFGLPEEHPKLHAYVYANSQPSPANERLPQSSTVAVAVQTDDGRDDADGDNNRGGGRENDRDDDSEKAKDKISEKERKLAKARKKQEEKELKASKKKDDDDDDEADDDDDEDGDNERTSRAASTKEKRDVAATATREVSKADQSTRVEVKAETSSNVATETVARAASANANSGGAITSLLAFGDYMSLADAIIRARTEGGTGEVLKVDLEWDPARSLATWDVTFSSGFEFELHASSGKLLAKKDKTGPKLDVLTPLSLEGSSKMKMLTFQEIIAKAEAARNQKVLEMELKHIKGRAETVFEVALADGMTVYFDASTGQLVPGL